MRSMLHAHLSMTLALLMLTAAVSTLSGCSTNEATGERNFLLMSMDQEVQIGAEAAPQFTAEFGGEVQDRALQDYVTTIGMKMARTTEGDFPKMPWTFTLLDSDVVNAFALPGGKVFITRGLARRMSSEAQLAGVIGHEIGHVTARHANQRISAATGFQTSLQVIGVLVGSASTASDSALAQVGQLAVPALSVGGEVVMLKFGRDDESQSDALGMRYMTNVGYNPAAQREVMQVLAEAGGGGQRPPEWLATHPYPETRIERIDELLRDEYKRYTVERGYKNFKHRYRNEFLDRLNALPAPRHTRMTEADDTMLAGAISECSCCE